MLVLSASPRMGGNSDLMCDQYQLEKLVDLWQFTCIYMFQMHIFLDLSFLRNVWKLVSGALCAHGNFEGFG